VSDEDNILELAKAARTAPSAALMAAGIYGGQYAKLYPDAYVELAVSGCLFAFWTGVILTALMGCTHLIDWARKD
jgi:hypothetical protein